MASEDVCLTGKGIIRNAAASPRRRRRAVTYAAKVFVQQLHVSVDDLERDELVVLVLDGAAEVQAGVSAAQQQEPSLCRQRHRMLLRREKCNIDPAGQAGAGPTF